MWLGEDELSRIREDLPTPLLDVASGEEARVPDDKTTSRSWWQAALLLQFRGWLFFLHGGWTTSGPADGQVIMPQPPESILPCLIGSAAHRLCGWSSNGACCGVGRGTVSVVILWECSVMWLHGDVNRTSLGISDGDVFHHALHTCAPCGILALENMLFYLLLNAFVVVAV